ncbi:MAG: 4-(cytidine 5'-diphospho)-2-C-methyl-D-erythritol kinase, partial [Steroidobacteraceae bacterium]|nr:4-(cytidine 5'-diphospho)-2-C-methyl-D-erythritol kinase [Steroidobacteraceae bacterium]
MTERHARRRRDWWPAPAKLNLCLHILGRRSDGYHELQTVFQLLDWCDELAFEPPQAPGVIERVEGPAGIDPKTDLAVRAAYALRAAALARGHPRAAELGARLRLHKRIPIGAGLGGGSSDAATALRALNHYWDLGFDLAELTAIGLRLGADVPVFLGGRSAWAEGIGERLTPIDLPQRWFLILYPGVAVRTAEVFQDPELTRNSPLMTIRGFFESGGRNDCEPLVRARYPAVAAAL